MARKFRGPQLKIPRAPKQERTAVFTRGPKELQGALQAGNSPALAPPPPPGWRGSAAEWWVYRAHQQLGLREGKDFRMQVGALGARQTLGGLVLDFLELDQPLAINVQGVYWHYGMGADKLATDRAQAALLAQRGIRLIWIDEDMAQRDGKYYVAEARKGIDHSRLTQGMTPWL